MELYAGSDLHSRNDLTVKDLEEWLHPYETIRVSPLVNHQFYFFLNGLGFLLCYTNGIRRSLHDRLETQGNNCT